MSSESAPYDLLGSSFGKSFVVRKVAKSRLLWLNKRWFFEQGHDVTDVSVLAKLEAQILDGYAAVAEPDYFPASALTSETQELKADRYGAPVGAPAGGSGRCGYRGDWNAKGIGSTPLVGRSSEVDWYHSHGCMWIEEAVREAVLAEVAGAEYPHGAVPILAIIDPFMRVHGPKPEHTGERRAIVIRPNFIRLAHLERSVRFGSSGTAESDQALDALRTREVFGALQRHFEGSIDLKLTVRSLDDAFRRLARQAGFSWAYRLFAGSLFSSNVTLDGELVDFGNFRALPDWHQCPRAGHAYGGDLNMLCHSIKSVRFYARKYGLSQDVTVTEHELARVAIEHFEDECAIALGLAEHARTIGSRMHQWMSQDAATFNTASGFDASKWIAQWTARAPFDSGNRREQLFCLLSEILGEDQAEQALQRAQTWMTPRHLLDREYMVNRYTALARSDQYNSDAYVSLIEQEIAHAVSQSRRRYKQLEAEDHLVAHAGDANSSVLRLQNRDGDQLMLIGSVQHGRALILGRVLGLDALSAECYVASGNQVSIRLPWPVNGFVNMGGVQIELPAVVPIVDQQDSGFSGMLPS